MIISQLTGGLGNQMFQYAAARALSHKLDMPLKLDISLFKQKSIRAYELHNFKINETFATESDLSFNSGIQAKFNRIRLKLGFNKFGDFFFYKEKEPFVFDERFFDRKEKIYLEGYFQNEKYFLGIKDILKKEFSLNNDELEGEDNVLNEILKHNSVSVHVRRGDYVSDKNANSVHGICSLDYYKNAIQAINKTIHNPVFFIFSDEIEWAKQNLQIDNATYVQGNDYKSHIDLFLMSRCKHNIIANSSFSWWAAWLNNNVNKQIIAPRRWLKTTQYRDSEILIAEWTKI